MGFEREESKLVKCIDFLRFLMEKGRVFVEMEVAVEETGFVTFRYFEVGIVGQ